MKIGFIGLGKIGTQMALRLIAAGHEVSCHSRNRARPDLQDAGAHVTTDIGKVADGAALLIVCVFNDQQLRDVLLDTGTLKALTPGTTIVIHTTAQPATIQNLAARAPDGIAIIDAPFSGDIAEIETASLTLMVGGDETALQRARPALSAYAGMIAHVGPLGSGQTMKLLNNTLFAAHVSLAIEALKSAEAAGISARAAADIFNTSSGQSYAMGMMTSDAPIDAVAANIRRYLDKDMDAMRAALADVGIKLDLLDTATASFGQKAP